jgi:hypothetical protein
LLESLDKTIERERVAASFVYGTFDGVMRAFQGFWGLDNARERRKLHRKFQINLECIMPGQLILLEKRRDQSGRPVCCVLNWLSPQMARNPSIRRMVP